MILTQITLTMGATVRERTVTLVVSFPQSDAGTTVLARVSPTRVELCRVCKQRKGEGYEPQAIFKLVLTYPDVDRMETLERRLMTKLCFPMIQFKVITIRMTFDTGLIND